MSIQNMVALADVLSMFVLIPLIIAGVGAVVALIALILRDAREPATSQPLVQINDYRRIAIVGDVEPDVAREALRPQIRDAHTVRGYLDE